MTIPRASISAVFAIVLAPLVLALAIFAGTILSATGLARAAPEAPDDLAAGFADPPASARPWVYWFWLDGNITADGITADLEAMARVGIGGVLIMEVDQGAPPGPVRFGSPRWREMFHRVCSEALRLGLEVNMNNDAGWCGSGGTWITPDVAMQKVVWTETAVEGPRRFEGALPAPAAVAGHYRDIAVLAFPTPGAARIESIARKAIHIPQGAPILSRATYSAAPAGSVVPRERVADLTARMDSQGRLAWDVPQGRWTILRLGHTPTGANNAPAPADARGLECDKLSREGAEAQFAGLMGKLIADVGPLAGKTLVSTHIDSWEVGVQNWTPRFREEFRRLRGYDLLDYLPAMTGRIVESTDVSERFLWDLRQTIGDLLLENYAGRFRELARERGLRLSIEGYSTCPTAELAYAGRADEPMAEFWSWDRFGAAFSCTEMASAGHVYGKPIIGAEAFTAHAGERWLGHPGNIKDIGDWAFCEGINRFVFHRYALQPWRDRRPGMSMGPWGLHYERTQTWWEQSREWHRYLSRCQYLLQKGLFVADICYLAPEGSPHTIDGQSFRARPESPPERPGNNFDVCPPEVVLTRMSVRGGRLVLPEGASYRLLALPQVETMTPGLLRKVRELAAAGATVVGPRPLASPSLTGWPASDGEVRELADDLWGAGSKPADEVDRVVGKGRVIWEAALARRSASDPDARLGKALWIWRGEGNPAAAAPVGKRWFRRTFEVDAASPIEAARLAITADNSFECRVNGTAIGSGNNFGRAYAYDVGPLLRPGANVIAVEAENGATAPNPAGLIASLAIRYRDGRTLELGTDRSWEASEKAGGPWEPALELGPLGMAPWGDIDQSAPYPDVFTDADALARILARLGTPPDFEYRARSSEMCLRFTHRAIGGIDAYFVASKSGQPEEALCTFRAGGRRPELWRPESGRIERPAAYEEAGGRVRMPLRFEPLESLFVVFRDPRAEPDRIVSVARDGEEIVATSAKPGEGAGDSDASRISGNFTIAVQVKPSADTELPPETAKGIAGMDAGRNDVVYPAPGHEAFGPGQAGCGIAAGRNGVCVFEHGADYFAPVLVHEARIDRWTHVAVVYRGGRPYLYLDGKLVRAGLQGPLTVHPGAGARHGRSVMPFRGERGEIRVFPRSLDDAEIAALARSMPARSAGSPLPSVEVVRGADGSLQGTAWSSGKYLLRTAGGATREVAVPALPAPAEIAGPWEVQFAPGGGAPERIALERLASWSEHSDPGVKFFSGTATYRRTFVIPAEMLAEGRRLFLDLGDVQVMAEVRVNGRDLGTLWKAPFRVEIGEAAKAGENVLEVKVVNLWVNRQIGDELLPEDSDRNPDGTLKSWPKWVDEGGPSPAGRHTFTSWRLWRKDAKPVPSGLIGPVTLVPAARFEAR